MEEQRTPLYRSATFSLFPDGVREGDNYAEAVTRTHLRAHYAGPRGEAHRPPPEAAGRDSKRTAAAEAKDWQMARELPDRPRYRSEQPIVDALFNLALEEAEANVEEDGTLRTGAKWGGVWTRDVSYATLLAFACHNPEAAKTSLRRKVKDGEAVQDTGSGGAWPVSTDRTTWILAAWEVYLVTGEGAWLREVYPVAKRTVDRDAETIYDGDTGLFRGESSFLDWREQTYPAWMDNADIYASECLGTNVVHCAANRIVARMATRLGEPAGAYERRAEACKAGINEYLWLEAEGRYAEYRYGRVHRTVSPRFEALGAALAVLTGVADGERAAAVVRRAPVTAYGVTCVYPQQPDVPPYHNNGIWPFVQAFWNLAAARSGRVAALEHGLACLYRPAALFLTNYENFVADTGDYRGTEINSHRMLWSIAGNLSMVYRVFLGMTFTEDGLSFRPLVPKSYAGARELANFRYRGATLSVEVSGFGGTVREVTMNGAPLPDGRVPGDLTGEHRIKIVLDGVEAAGEAQWIAPNRFAPRVPRVQMAGDRLRWAEIAGAAAYRIYRNGSPQATTEATSFGIDPEDRARYRVSAVGADGSASFTSAPVARATGERCLDLATFAPPSGLPYTGFTGDGFVAATTDENLRIRIGLRVARTGDYLLDVRYANGSGPWNTDNKCAVRSLLVDGAYTGLLVFPQRGENLWSDWGYSNVLSLALEAGEHTLTILYEARNRNMDGTTNRVMLDQLRLVPDPA